VCRLEVSVISHFLSESCKNRIDSWFRLASLIKSAFVDYHELRWMKYEKFVITMKPSVRVNIIP
jgi:hypothetical protein